MNIAVSDPCLWAFQRLEPETLFQIRTATSPTIASSASFMPAANIPTHTDNAPSLTKVNATPNPMIASQNIISLLQKSIEELQYLLLERQVVSFQDS
jgi:hypothetical protein